jgi:hypothetical protein
VAGRNLGAMTARERLAYRRSVVGFIWQQSSRNLLPYMTARQNVLLPMRSGPNPRAFDDLQSAVLVTSPAGVRMLMIPVPASSWFHVGLKVSVFPGPAEPGGAANLTGRPAVSTVDSSSE